MKEIYVGKSLTALNALNDKGGLFYSKPMSKEEAVAMLRKYAQEFPFRYVNEEVGYVHGRDGFFELCRACQLDYGDASMNAVKIPYRIDENASLSDVQAAVRGIILEECDAIMAIDDNYEMFLHACVLHAVLNAYRTYVNKGIKGVKDGKVSGLLNYGKTRRIDRVVQNTLDADYPDMIQIVDDSCMNKFKPVLGD